MNIPGVDNLEFGPAYITYTFPKGSVLPKVGDIIDDGKCRMEVTESNQEKLYIRVLLTSTESVETRMKRYIEEIECCMVHIAEKLFRSTTSGMTALIDWEDLPNEEQDKYLKMSREVIEYLNENNLLILQYQPENWT